jgi:hypothetical protein
MQFSALNAEINIVSSSYNMQIIFFYFLLRIDLKTKFNFALLAVKNINIISITACGQK